MTYSFIFISFARNFLERYYYFKFIILKNFLKNILLGQLPASHDNLEVMYFTWNKITCSTKKYCVTR